MTPPVSLHSMPLNLDAWAKIVTGLSALQEGCLLRAVRAAWTAEHRAMPPATLPNDDAELARIIGDAKQVEIVRRYFVPRDGAPYQLEWAWLVEEYRAAMGRYLARKLGGTLTGAKRSEAAAVRRLQAARVPRPAQAEHDAEHQAELKQPEPDRSKKALLAAEGALPLGRQAPTPQDLPQDPPRIGAAEVAAWAALHPAEAEAARVAVETKLTEDNPGWCERRSGPGLRDRLVEARLAALVAAERRALPAFVPLAGDTRAGGDDGAG